MPCPACQNPPHQDFAPFCSKLCKNRDLLKWLKEEYVIPAENVADENAVPAEDEEN